LNFGVVADDDPELKINQHIEVDLAKLRTDIEDAISMLEDQDSIIEELQIALEDEQHLQEPSCDDTEPRGRKRTNEKIQDSDSERPLKKEKLDDDDDEAASSADRPEDDTTPSQLSLNTRSSVEDSNSAVSSLSHSRKPQLVDENDQSNDKDNATHVSPDDTSKESSGSFDANMYDSDGAHRYPKRARQPKKYKEDESSGTEDGEIVDEGTSNSGGSTPHQ
jgi:hypothetical protein